MEEEQEHLTWELFHVQSTISAGNLPPKTREQRSTFVELQKYLTLERCACFPEIKDKVVSH